MKHILLLLSLLLSSNFLVGQARNDLRVPGELIIQFEPKTDVKVWLNNRTNEKAFDVHLEHIKSLGIRNNIHHFKFEESTINLNDFLAQIRSKKGVLTAQYNYEVEFRQTPNDLLYDEQWDMDIINAAQAWDITTGGKTADGTRIVIANMDSGFEVNHPDLIENLWHNTYEIIGDNIDNDNNGYIDDDIGWDFYTDSPNITIGHHGTSTTGILGAKGNNEMGVTGVNWDVDIMVFSFRFITDLILAYDYVIDQRMRFNESQGTEGAFVVATNASFGQEQVCCEQQPAWAAMYDLMGDVGILTSAGVANSPYNADQLCDMPASCTSDYLLISCNTDMDDNLDQTSAYGPISVDIGSPGGQSYTTGGNSSYSTFGGNSAATPHVTGAIALLYSAPFPELKQMAIQQPKETALLIKNYIISTVDPLISLEGKAASGGRLNLGRSMEALVADNNNLLGDLQVSTLYPNPTDKGITVDFLTPDNDSYFAEIYNSVGQLLFIQEVTVGETGIRSFYVETDHLPEGVYILNFGRKDTWVINKFVINR